MRIGLIAILLTSQMGWSQIRISEPIQDLGDVFENKGRVKAVFNLVNPYFEDTILIENIVTPCGCTAVLTEERMIMPRSSLDLEIAYDPENRPGLFVKSIRVETITGRDEHNSLYLKIKGNVVAENALIEESDVSLKEYKVVPIYFFPITPYDTSYLDFNYFISFINDLSYEIDFFQFTTIGFEIEVDDDSQIEELEHLMNFCMRRIQKGFSKRGFPTETVFFQTPIFKEAEVPVWASARVKVFSVNFNDDEEEESVIDVSDNKIVDDESLLLRENRFRIPTVGEILEGIEMNRLESKLFMNGRIDLSGRFLISQRSSLSDAEKLVEKLEKKLYKTLRKKAGLDKEKFSFSIDSIEVHPEDRVELILWDRSDEKKQTSLNYTIREDQITPPFLPTYRQTILFQNTIDQATREFRRFWKNMIKNQQFTPMKILVEASVSQRPDVRDSLDDKAAYVRRIAEEAKSFLIKKFKNETNRNLEVEVIELVRGPAWDSTADLRLYDEFEYMNLIPLVHHRSEGKEPKANPYQVNFDFFFNGIDTTSLVFNNFTRYIRKTVEQDGYVELRIESSISQIPVEKHLSNLELAYHRSYESQQRLKQHLARKLVDPNRILFVEERNLIQGPPYDGTTPILKYRPYQYIRIVPDKALRP